MLKFKTNARCGGCQSAIIGALSSLAPMSEWEMDLTSPDKVLTYVGTKVLNPESIMGIVRDTGFEISQLPA